MNHVATTQPRPSVRPLAVCFDRDPRSECGSRITPTVGRVLQVKAGHKIVCGECHQAPRSEPEERVDWAGRKARPNGKAREPGWRGPQDDDGGEGA